jgi:hypothetical protein
MENESWDANSLLEKKSVTVVKSEDNSVVVICEIKSEIYRKFVL